MRIGITQRVAYDPNYGERRDALATDWYRFLLRVWPDAVIVPIPNRPDHVARLLDTVAPDLLVLTGGNDLGTEPERDQTERACLLEAARRELPVIGVCRGFQMMVDHDGGSLAPVERTEHVATRHPVHCLRDTAWGWAAGRSLDVNSYHGFAVPSDGLPGTWIALAQGADGTVEAACTNDGRCTAVMWHPEREPEPAPLDVALFRQCLTRGQMP
jgi:putative glutamine amidotransferase